MDVNRLTKNDRAVSSVIAVILLVAITVSLVVLVTVSVFLIGGDSPDNPADITVETDQTDNSIIATVISNENVETLVFQHPNGTNKTLSEPTGGDTIEYVKDKAGTYTLIAITNGGKKQVLKEISVSESEKIEIFDPGSEAFVLRVDSGISSGNNTSKGKFRIGTNSLFPDYSYDVEWENVNNPSDNGSATNVNGDYIINFSNNDTYDIAITGKFPHFVHQKSTFPLQHTDAVKITGIRNWGNIKWESMKYMFQNAKNLDSYNAPDSPEFSEDGVSLNYMFHRAISFNGDISDWNTSNVDDLRSTFEDADSFNQPIGSWNTSRVSFYGLNDAFRNADSFNQPLNNWDTSNVEAMNKTFMNAKSFNQDLDSWNTSNVKFMDYMFKGASSFNGKIGSWNTSNVRDMDQIFTEASSFNQSLNNWNTSSITDMNYMFSGASSFNQPLDNWDTSSVTNMKLMFRDANSFNGSIGSWDTSSLTNTQEMFENADSFNNPSINNWDTSSVTTMSGMFDNASSFNQDISSWDTSSVDDLDLTFARASSFNQSLNSWNTSNVTSMSATFYRASSFNKSLDNWDTSNVEAMNSMFWDAKKFDQDISNWCVKKIDDEPVEFDLNSGFQDEPSKQPNWGDTC